MRSNCSSFDTPQFRILSDRQIQDIHLATLEVLQRTGVRIYDEDGLELLRRAGARVADGNLVHIPEHLAEWALRVAPSRITIYSRDGKPAMYLEDNKVYAGTGPSLPNMIDPYTGERRAVCKQDVANVAKLVDALPNIDYVMSLGIVSNCPLGLADCEEFEAMVLNTTKPIIGWGYDADGYEAIVEMGVAVRGSLEELQHRPFFILYSEPTSPLKHSKESIQKLLFMAERNLPNLYTPGVMLGATGPATLAGTLVVVNTELLTGLVLSQLKREGSPFIYGGGAMQLDLKTTVDCFGAPESFLNSAALTDMAHYYHIPSWSFGGNSDAKVFDEQAAMEGAMATMMASLSGANLIHDIGYIESGLTASLEMVVVQNDVLGMMKRILGGVKVDDETLAVDVIDEVGPGGHFLGTEHTLKHYRESWYPSVLDRQNYEEWAQGGKKTLRDRANARVRQIIETHHPAQLPEEVRGKIAQVVREAEQKAETKS